MRPPGVPRLLRRPRRGQGGAGLRVPLARTAQALALGCGLAASFTVLLDGPGAGVLWLGGLGLGLGLLASVLAHGQFTDAGPWGRFVSCWVPLGAAAAALAGAALLATLGADGLRAVLLLYLAGLAAAGLLGSFAGFRQLRGPFGRLAARWRANATVLACLLFVAVRPAVPDVGPLQLDLLALAYAALSLAWFWAREEMLHGRPIESGLVRTHSQSVLPVADPHAQEAARILAKHLATGQAADQYAGVLRVLAVRHAAKPPEPLDLPARLPGLPPARLHLAALLRAASWAVLAASAATLVNAEWAWPVGALAFAAMLPGSAWSLSGPGYPLGPLPWAVAAACVVAAILPISIHLELWGLAITGAVALPFAIAAVRAVLRRPEAWPVAAQLDHAERLARRWPVALGLGVLLAFLGAAAPMGKDTLRSVLDEPDLEIPLHVPLALAAAGLLRIGAAALAGPANRAHTAILKRLAAADATRRRTHHARILTRLETAL